MTSNDTFFFVVFAYHTTNLFSLQNVWEHVKEKYMYILKKNIYYFVELFFKYVFPNASI
jgi:hypothetical protein